MRTSQVIVCMELVVAAQMNESSLVNGFFREQVLNLARC